MVYGLGYRFGVVGFLGCGDQGLQLCFRECGLSVYGT